MAELDATYDGQADAAYICFEDPAQAVTPGVVAKTYICDLSAFNGMINLDFDKEGRVIGIEVLGARSNLPSYLLDSAKRLDR